ncbi:MAG: DNA-3-methyladenine glycosylase 2 family protein [Acholeplasmataceae bacterium]|nr:DNA-3-methyladenine glycosylase 2 family protein [Acholeplasmataceae bacterium]
MDNYFKYSQIELDYLSKKDKKLAKIINEVGFIKRKTNSNIYLTIIESIISQQISTKAQKTILSRFYNMFTTTTPNTISKITAEELQKIGISFRKANYIIDFTKDIIEGKLDLDNLENKTDEEVILLLSSIKGVGRWTAEMTLISSLSRPNVLSYNDLGIQRGLKMLYNLDKIDKETFNQYAKLFSPYCTIASFYLWEIASNKTSLKPIR